MTSYPRPNDFTPGTFNRQYYVSTEDSLTFAEADRRYLRLSGGVLSGGVTFNSSLVSDGNLFLSDGKIDDLAISFTDDANLGIYRSGSDTMNFVAAGSNIMTIGSSGVAIDSLILNEIDFTDETLNVIQFPDSTATALRFRDSNSNSYATLNTISNDFTINVPLLIGSALGNGSLTFSGTSTGTNSVNIQNNIADSLTFKDIAADYLRFVTTTGSLSIDALQDLRIGTASTGNLSFRSTTTNVAKITFQDNLAKALKFVSSDSTEYLNFKSENGNEYIEALKPFVVANAIGLSFTSLNAKITIPSNTATALALVAGVGGTTMMTFDSLTAAEKVVFNVSPEINNIIVPATGGANEIINLQNYMGLNINSPVSRPLNFGGATSYWTIGDSTVGNGNLRWINASGANASGTIEFTIPDVCNLTNQSLKLVSFTIHLSSASANDMIDAVAIRGYNSSGATTIYDDATNRTASGEYTYTLSSPHDCNNFEMVKISLLGTSNGSGAAAGLRLSYITYKFYYS